MSGRFARCRGQRKPRQGWQRPRAGFSHDRSPVVFDRALANAKIGGYIYAGVSSEHHGHNVKLVGRKFCKARLGLNVPRQLGRGVS
jgi:hypothetical protein